MRSLYLPNQVQKQFFSQFDVVHVHPERFQLDHQVLFRLFGAALLLESADCFTGIDEQFLGLDGFVSSHAEAELIAESHQLSIFLVGEEESLLKYPFALAKVGSEFNLNILSTVEGLDDGGLFGVYVYDFDDSIPVLPSVLDVEFVGERSADLHLFVIGVADDSDLEVFIHFQYALDDGGLMFLLDLFNYCRDDLFLLRSGLGVHQSEEFLPVFDNFVCVVIFALTSADLAESGIAVYLLQSLAIAVVADIELSGQIVERDRWHFNFLLLLYLSLFLLLQLLRQNHRNVT